MRPRSIVVLAALVACGSSSGSGDGAAEAGPTDAAPADAGSADGAATGGDGAGDAAAPPPRVLVYSRTAGFRHDSIPDAIRTIAELGAPRGWTVTATEDPATFTAALTTSDVAVFALTSGDVLDDTQQASYEAFVRAGGGTVGLHSASDTEYAWPFYQALVGGTFAGHPAGTPTATLHVSDRTHPASAALPDPWTRADEWYSFRSNPKDDPNVHVLVTIDESTYDPGALAMGAVHPMVWWQTYQGGRSFYCELGHTSATYDEAPYRDMLAAAIVWAAKR